MSADEVENRAHGLVVCDPQTATELLEKQRRALGWPQHEHDVDGRYVDALVEQIDREHDLDSSLGETAQRIAAFVAGVSPETATAETRALETAEP